MTQKLNDFVQYCNIIFEYYTKNKYKNAYNIIVKNIIKIILFMNSIF